MGYVIGVILSFWGFFSLADKVAAHDLGAEIVAGIVVLLFVIEAIRIGRK